MERLIIDFPSLLLRTSPAFSSDRRNTQNIGVVQPRFEVRLQSRHWRTGSLLFLFSHSAMEISSNVRQQYTEDGCF